MRLIFTLICFFFFETIHAQKPTIYVMGTMHTVPKIVSGSYKLMFKKGVDFAPDAIFVEYPMASDSLSMNNRFDRFLQVSDSLTKVFDLDISRVKKLVKGSLLLMTPDDFRYLSRYFLVQKDYANYRFYRHLYTHGLKGFKKPSRNENVGVSFKLAVALDHTILWSMDDQQTTSEYQKYWNACYQYADSTNQIKLLQKWNKQDYNKAIFPALTGKLSRYTNKEKSLLRVHAINSFAYMKEKSASCSTAFTYWEMRNSKMAGNIAKQVKKGGHEKAMVVVGAGHVVGIVDALKEQYPEATIVTWHMP